MNVFANCPAPTHPSPPPKKVHPNFVCLTAGVVGGCHWGLGVGSGIVISGLFINWVGVARTYFIYSLTSLVVLVLFLSAHLFVKLREGKCDSGDCYKLVPTSEEEPQE